MEPQPCGGDERRWEELLAQYDLVQGATRLALRALLEAYQPHPNGSATPTDELLARYRNASAMRLAAEQALLDFARTYGLQSNGH